MHSVYLPCTGVLAPSQHAIGFLGCTQHEDVTCVLPCCVLLPAGGQGTGHPIIPAH
jgi:hypothetical protein